MSEIATVKTDLSADNADIRNDLRRMDGRLRLVELAFGNVDQRLKTLERLPQPAGASGNGGPTGTGSPLTARRFRTT